jgi:hypothetical protein
MRYCCQAVSDTPLTPPTSQPWRSTYVVTLREGEEGEGLPAGRLGRGAQLWRALGAEAAYRPRAVLLNASSLQVSLRPLELEAFRRAYASRIASLSMLPPADKYLASTLSGLRETASLPGTVALFVTLPPPDTDSGTEAEAERNHFIVDLVEICATCTVSFDDNTEGPGTGGGTGDRDGDSLRLSVEAARAEASLLLLALADLDSVLWIEQRAAYESFNRWAVELLRGDAGVGGGMGNLTGEGMVIGLADTGVDMNSCFFSDTENQITYNEVIRHHRKLVYYNTLYGDRLDGDSGHGTHVGGSLAGACLDPGLEAYGGVARGAKLAVFDIEGAAGYLRVPYNLGNLFKPMYNAGARIFSNSWGNPGVGGSANVYSMDSREVDLFMHSYPDSLVIFAGGNSGDFGAHSVSSPSTNKNGLCVGASLNSHDSFDQAAPSAFNQEGVAYFSSMGPTGDNRLKPDILAPGRVAPISLDLHPIQHNNTTLSLLYSLE